MPLSSMDVFDLLWRFGEGSDLIARGASGIPEAGVLGSGNSGTKGVFSGEGPDPRSLSRFGRIERVLRLAGPTASGVLALAYGDAGALATWAGMRPGQRWRSIASLTAMAIEGASSWKPKEKRHELVFTADALALDQRRAKAWTPRPPKVKPKPGKPVNPAKVQAKEAARDDQLGPRAVRWVHGVLSAPGGVNAAASRALELQSKVLLLASEAAYDKARRDLAVVTRAHADEAERVARFRGLMADQVWAKEGLGG